MSGWNARFPGWSRTPPANRLTLEVAVERGRFEKLIKDKVDRTIDCCHEALARAKERAGIRLSDIDYVVLVGGSSRLPLVRDTVREAFCNGDLPEHVKCLQPLLHEPDLCVAYGAALRRHARDTVSVSAGGRRNRMQTGRTASSCTGPARPRPVTRITTPPAWFGYTSAQSSVLSPQSSADRWRAARCVCAIGSTGMVEEAFLDGRATFAQDLELQPGSDNAFDVTVCDGAGAELAPAGGDGAASGPGPAAWPGGAAHPADHQTAADRGAQSQPAARQAGGRAHRRHLAG